MIDYYSFYQRWYSYSKSDLKRIAKEGQEVILRNYGPDSLHGNYYYDNIIETAFYADGSVTYDELDFFNSTSTYKQIDLTELNRICRQAWEVCEYYDTIPNTKNNRGSEVANAVIVITLCACLIDGSFKPGEIRYINKLVGYNLI